MNVSWRRPSNNVGLKGRDGRGPEGRGSGEVEGLRAGVQGFRGSRGSEDRGARGVGTKPS